MRVTLHNESHAENRTSIHDHVHNSLHDAMARFGDRVTAVDAFLTDGKGSAKPGADSTNCTLEARLLHSEAVVVKAKAVNAHGALASAVRKLKQAVGASVARNDPRRSAARHLRQTLLETQMLTTTTPLQPLTAGHPK
jgi:hypothetical protein